MKSIKILLLLTFVSFLKPGWGQELSHIPGAFADIGFGGRALGMGGAFVASANDVHSVIWNPAGLVQAPGWQGTFSYTRQLGVIPYAFLGLSGRFNNLWAHGEAVIISGDNLYQEIQVLLALARNFQYQIRGLRMGATLSLRQASYGWNASGNSGAIHGTAYGAALTLGVQYEYSTKLVLGLKLQDILNSMNWATSGLGNYFESTPFAVIAGINLREVKGFNLEVDLQSGIYQDVPLRLSVGGEKPFFRYFVLRAGTARNLNAIESNVQHALGIGFQNLLNDHFRLDFAYLFHEIENHYRVSVVFRR